LNLTIGMATAHDFDGVWFTVQALRLYYGFWTEIIVVDNAPTSKHGDMTAKYVASLGDPAIRYIAMPAPQGTAPPRQRVFDEATGDVVLCIDSHVLLWPGSLERLIGYFRANPDTRDLVSGPMVYDNLRATADLFMDVWNQGMRGIWSAAWRCRCGRGYCTLNTPSGAAVCDMMPPHLPTRKCHDCGLPFPLVPWAGHEAALKAAGLSLIATEPPDAPPIDVPAQGLGAFAMRKAAWPGFNPNFRGFGGEELYIHEKVQRAGGRVLCLPGFRWNHRFGRPEPIKYPLTMWHRVRNYVIGHQELGLPIEPIREHFVEAFRQSGFTQTDWESLISNGLPESPPKAKSSCGACGVPAEMTLEQWYHQVATKTSDINEHVPILRELASKCEHVTEFGTRAGTSTVALLAGQPKRLVSVDKVTPSNLDELKKRAGATDFAFVEGDSRAVHVEPTDMLFVDTLHTANHVLAELDNAAPKVRKYIVFHDTEAPWGERGEDGGPGVMPAVRLFLMRHPEWVVKAHHRNNHGLTIISRLAEDRKELPSLLRQAWNMTKAQTRHALNGDKYLPLPLAEERQRECSVCEFRSGEQCSMCGCYLRQIPDSAPLRAGQPGKTFYPTEGCPLGKWHPRPDDGVEMTAEQVAEMLK